MSDLFTVHHMPEAHPDTSAPDPHQDTFSKTFLGFWTYLMTDCILFATLFVTYVVMHDHTFGGATSKELFSLSTAYIETMVLLFSSVTCGFAVLAAIKSKRNHVIAWLSVTFLLGASFLFLELSEFSRLVAEGHSWKESAFLSAFFTLVGTHGLHITTGLLWTIVVIGQLLFYGITSHTFRRLVIFSLFWHRFGTKMAQTKQGE